MTHVDLSAASYVIGQPVIVHLFPDRHVEFEVDLSDVARTRDVGEQVDWPDQRVDDVCDAVQAAVDSGNFTLRRS